MSEPDSEVPTELPVDVPVDVTVVGCGPVGIVLAILLAQRGRTVTILERWPEPYPMPRAVHFDDEVARILQACGLGEALGRISEPADIYEWCNADGTTLVRFGRNGPGGSGWPASSMFNQPALEALLEARVRELPTIELRRGVEVVGLDQDDDGVTIRAVALDGDAVAVRSRYAVGCDGANSTIRGLVGVPVHDLGYFYDWLIVDVILNEPRVFDPINLQVCDPARPTTVVSGGPGRRRWEFMRLPDEDIADLNDIDAAWKLLADWDVTPDNAVLERHAVYTFNARYADDWRRGRVFLAGDAAHLMPPFAGQGMCSGLRDACNLAWKLDLALAEALHNRLGGQATGNLLDSYTGERLPSARAVIELSIELGRIICVPDAAEAAARDELMSAAVTDAATAIPPPPFLTGALLPADDPVAGHLFVQGNVASAGRVRRFDDVHGVGWRLVTIGDPAIDLEPPRAAWFAAIGGSIVAVAPADDVDGTYGEWFAAHDARWALQRPDFHVHGIASDATGAALLLADVQHRLRGDPHDEGTTS
jgi:2-polyprenyl-6-methoxyphenol hydroxylase-like FAD-dependent oxidoreductase